MNAIEKRGKLKTCQINNALGFFMLVFGLIVVFSMSLSETFTQRMVNIIAGGSIVLIGGGMMLNSRRLIKKHDLKNIENSINPK